MVLFKKKLKNDADASQMPVEKPVDLAKKPTKKAKELKAPKEPKVPQPKVPPDVYTLLLGISTVALLIAVVLLFLNTNAYGPNPLSGLPR